METPPDHIDLISSDPAVIISPSAPGEIDASSPAGNLAGGAAAQPTGHQAADGSQLAGSPTNTQPAGDRATPGAPQPAGNQSSENRRAFTITLRPGTTIGAISGRLAAVLQAEAEQPITLAELPYTGIVSGEITASPQVIAFGTSPQGHAATQQILITGGDVEHIAVAAGSPWITAVFTGKPIDAARFNHPFGAAPADNTAPVADADKAILLTVTLSPKTPAGTLESTLTLTTAHNQTLKLPVYAVVTHP